MTEKEEIAIKKYRLEVDKVWIDFLKHLTTLNTGAIILISSLSESIMPNTSPQTIVAAIVCFFISLLSCIAGLMYLLPARDPKFKETPLYASIGKATYLFASLGFLSGILIFIFGHMQNARP